MLGPVQNLILFEVSFVQRSGIQNARIEHFVNLRSSVQIILNGGGLFLHVFVCQVQNSIFFKGLPMCEICDMNNVHE